MVCCRTLLREPFKQRLDETMTFGKGWLCLMGVGLFYFSPVGKKMFVCFT